MNRNECLKQLGFATWLYQASAPQKITNQFCLVFELKRNLSAETAQLERQLLFKMLTAIDIKAKQITVVTLDKKEDLPLALSRYQATVTILMLGEPVAGAEQDGVFSTYHPSALLENQQLKRQSWQELKQIKQWLIKQKIHTA